MCLLLDVIAFSRLGPLECVWRDCLRQVLVRGFRVVSGGLKGGVMFEEVA